MLLESGTRAFERLLEGISRRMLTLTLRNVERDGLLCRKVHATVPPGSSTPPQAWLANCTTRSPLSPSGLSERHRADIAEARSFYDGKRDDPAA